jgi:hypothetical protein
MGERQETEVKKSRALGDRMYSDKPYAQSSCFFAPEPNTPGVRRSPPQRLPSPAVLPYMLHNVQHCPKVCLGGCKVEGCQCSYRHCNVRSRRLCQMQQAPNASPKIQLDSHFVSVLHNSELREHFTPQPKRLCQSQRFALVADADGPS